MNLPSLTDKAMELRARFDRAAQTSGRPAWTAEQIMQGFVVDVGALMKLVMAKAGTRDVHDLDRKLGHELADCLWSVLVLAKCYNVDLEKEFSSMIETVSADLARPKAAPLAPTPTNTP